MPIAAHPLRREFYVYTFHVDGYPFYVGIGRDQRGPDRLRYVRSLTPAKIKKRSLSVRVMAVLDKKAELKPLYVRRGLTRNRALALEKATIARYVRKGYLLTNWQHNPMRHNDQKLALAAILLNWKHRISN